MAVLISLVCFSSSPPLPAGYPLFLGVALFGLVTDGAHDVDLRSVSSMA
jgi:hypothetical protein